MHSWRKLGLLYAPDGAHEWNHTHAAVPFAKLLGGDTYRVYVSGRDRSGRSHTGWFDAELGSEPKVTQVGSDAVLSPGAPGTFDSDGAMLSWIARSGNSDYCYYIGWNRGVDVPFRNALGLARSRNGDPEMRKVAGPILDRSIHDPCFTASACVIPGEDKWKMWYLSCVAWEFVNGAPRHRYHIKYAESRDGINWNREGVVAIDFADESEYAISRPSVIQDGDLWKMWYSCRGTAYRIGYAESRDGVAWTRRDADAGISVSEIGWDSEMIEYPHVINHRGQLYMFYNGNGYGASGVGLAVLED